MSCFTPPADGPRQKPVPDSTGHYASIQDLEASGEREQFQEKTSCNSYIDKSINNLTKTKISTTNNIKELYEI